MDLWMKVVDEMAVRWKERCDKDSNGKPVLRLELLAA